MNHRVFVGTLYSNENDFEKCCAMIQTQQNVIVTHRIISGLEEVVAHNALWSAWRYNQQSHDFFIKIDADTVLTSETTLFDICECITNFDASGLQAPLYDYFTNDTIYGLNAYS